jgi:Flp pilus assembly protein TadD
MKRFILMLACAAMLCAMAGCRDSDGKSGDSSSSTQETTGKKSHFVIEEVAE